MTYVIGMDAGGTKTVGLLADTDGEVLASARRGGANLQIHGEAVVDQVLTEIVEELSSRGAVDAICIGAAGVDRPVEREAIHRTLDRFGAQVTIVNDARIALVAGAPERAGIVLVAGTGSIAYGVDRAGRTARSGGWGYLLADEGSAFWLGQQALRRAVRGADGRGASTLLGEKISAYLATSVPEGLVAWAYAQDSARYGIARLAPLVAAAAEAGDEIARELLDEAADHLVEAASSVERQLGFREPYDVVLSGGVFRGCPAVVRRIEERLAATPARVGLLSGEPAQGAVKLALDLLNR